MFSIESMVIAALTMLQFIAIAASDGQIEKQQAANAQDLGTKHTPNETVGNGRSMNQQTSLSDGQISLEKPQQRGRSGRMMDLDHLVGAIGKDEKLARERSLNGNRQSRILSEDILPLTVGSSSSSSSSESAKTEPRSKKNNRKSGNKKMTIKGFIPIVSMEGHKGENPLEDEESGSDDDDDRAEFGQENKQPSPEQLLSGYGSQTSMGHASFVSSASEQSSKQQQQQPQWQNLNGAGQMDQPPDAARARKLLHVNSNHLGAGLLGSLSAAPKGLFSTLVPVNQQHQSPYNHAQTSLQGSLNVPHHQPDHQVSGGGECICVPFFQCRNGYLNPNQLSKSQLQQISLAAASPMMLQQQVALHQQHQHQQHIHQGPRALKSANDLYYNNQGASIGNQQHDAQPTAQTAGLSMSQPDDQQALSDAYEQLKKSMEGENIEQLLLQQQQQQQQMTNLPLLDERSKSGGHQMEPAAGVNSSTPEGETQERSLLPNPLAGRRSSSQQRSCGIMRTCCKISPGGFLNRGPQAQRLLQQQQLDLQIPKAQQFYPPPRGQQQDLYQQQQQQQHHQFTDNHPAPSSLAQAPSVHSHQYHHQQQPLVSRPPAQHPMGSFMAGRCGTRQALGVAGRVQNIQPAPGSETTAEFGEFPSHAAILKRLSPGDSLFVCSAVLISNQWLATAAHCIRRHRPDELKVRLGEWDVQRDDEFYPFAEINVRDIIINPEFQPSSLINDLALIRLESSLDAQQMPHIAPACLATPDEIFARQRCWLTGWGKDAFGQAGSFQSTLKKVDLPVMERQQCESALRYQTKLGKFFRLHQSALCAGGERGKDACEGDGGSGLYCTDPETGLTKAVGLVSWGVGCGQVGVPGVYTNLALFYPWIESVVAASGEENLYMDRNAAAAGNAIPDSVFKSLVSERSNQAPPNNATLSLSSDQSVASNSSIPAAEDSQPSVGEDVESRAGRR